MLATIIIFDPNDIVQSNRIIDYKITANTETYIEEQNKVINPNFDGIDKEHFKTYFYQYYVDNGSIIEITDEEKLNELNRTSLKIYDYIDKKSYSVSNYTIPPKNFPYNVLPLIKKKTKVKGDVTKIIYYGEYNQETDTYSIPVIREDRIYNMADGIYTYRPMKITWYWNDGSEHSITKDKPKYYPPDDGIKAVKKKRENIIDTVSTNLIGFLLMTGESVTKEEAIETTQNYAGSIDLEISKYLKNTRQPLIDKITNDTTNLWLDNEVPQDGSLTIRQLILNELNY